MLDALLGSWYRASKRSIQPNIMLIPIQSSFQQRTYILPANYQQNLKYYYELCIGQHQGPIHPRQNLMPNRMIVTMGYDKSLCYSHYGRWYYHDHYAFRNIPLKSSRRLNFVRSLVTSSLSHGYQASNYHDQHQNDDNADDVEDYDESHSSEFVLPAFDDILERRAQEAVQTYRHISEAILVQVGASGHEGDGDDRQKNSSKNPWLNTSLAELQTMSRDYQHVFDLMKERDSILEQISATRAMLVEQEQETEVGQSRQHGTGTNRTDPGSTSMADSAEEQEELRELIVEEMKDLKSQKDRIQDDIILELIDLCKKNAEKTGKAIVLPSVQAEYTLLEIKAGAGGSESMLFAHELLEMYKAFFRNKSWRYEVLSMSDSELRSSLREVVVRIGPSYDAYEILRHEAGVHRVQRVPQTENAGRLHTSTASVVVLPEGQREDVDKIHVPDSELRIDTFRSGGPGGQHANVTDSAVRLTHLPTGIVVSCQDERSQHRNKAKAMIVLKTRIAAARKREEMIRWSTLRRGQIGVAGAGVRSDRIRTYNFKESRVTDHRGRGIEVVGGLDDVLQGGKSLEEINQRVARVEKQESFNAILNELTSAKQWPQSADITRREELDGC